MKLLSDKVMTAALLLSISLHALSLGILSGFSSNLFREKKSEIFEVAYLEIKKPPLLPEINIMGEEKKIPQESNLKSELGAENSNLVVESVPEVKERIEDLTDRVFSEVEVLNPTEEAMLRYQDIVKQKIEAVRRYPFWAKKQGIEGRAHISFIITSNGNCRKIELVKSSRSSILDEEAIATIKRANPFPPLPQEINSSYVTIDVDIVFSLKYEKF